MGQLADTLGVGPLFTRDGKEYQATPIKPYHRAMFEAKLEQWGWEAIERSKSWVSEAVLRLNISVLQQDIVAQRYSQSSQNYDDASRSRAGIRYLLTLMLRDQPKEKDDEWRARHLAIDEAWVDKWLTEDVETAIRIYNEAIGVKPKDDKKDDEQSAGGLPGEA